jgi:mannosyl-3-phosphoglycerate phosphatase
LVFTDLDATLLDHNYSWAAAKPAIGRLRDSETPLVLNSSKTLAEMEALAAALDLNAPIIAENGGLLALPESSGVASCGGVDYAIKVRGLARQDILEAAHGLRAREGYQFSGFADWSTAELAALTGLSTEQAEASRKRFATEPIRWEDSEPNRLRFAESLSEKGIRMLRGGRFWHLMGAADKADGVAAVRAYFEEKEPATDWRVVALGDSANDTAMLEAADIAVVIPHEDGPRIQPETARLIHAPFPVSAGWNAAVLALLDEFQQSLTN